MLPALRSSAALQAGQKRRGQFFADLVRITTRILLPFSIVGGLLLVWQGVPQNFEGNVVVETLEGTFQVIAMGPIAARWRSSSIWARTAAASWAQTRLRR